MLLLILKINCPQLSFEEGEKQTRYFFRLEKTRAASNSFTSLFDENRVEKNLQDDLERIDSFLSGFVYE